MTRRPKLIQFISLHSFDEMAEELLLDDDAIRLIQQTLEDNPKSGTVVRGTGGLRKLRISLPRRGKRGGARLLYLYVQIRGVIYFVAVYAKSDQEDITPAGYAYLARLVKALKEEA